MAYNIHTLSNGLRIIHAPNQSAVAYCGFAIDAGTRDEAENEQGMAHFVEHLLFKGTQKRHAWHILNRMEHVGGDLNAYTNKEETVVYSAFLVEHFPRAVELLADIVFQSTFPQAEIDKEVEVIIDEIQKIPQLLDEVHWLIVNRGIRFILCGSSARKLKRVGTNLLGGRALSVNLYPLVSAEIPDFDLIRAINHGMIPRHYLAANPKKRLQAYIGTYLKEEIQDEAVVRQLASFNRFLDIAAQCDGEMVNYSNVAQDCGVSAVTVKEYFNILEQTLIGYMIPAFTQSRKRRAVTTSRF